MQVFRCFGVYGVLVGLGGVLGGLGGVFGRFGGLILVSPDKNDPRCNMGFGSDTFSGKKMLKTGEILIFVQK